MRLLVFCLETDVERLVSGYRTRCMAKYMARAGHHIDLVCSTSKPLTREESYGRVIGVPMPRNSRPIDRYINRLLYWPGPERRWVAPAMTRLDEIFREARPDAVVVSTPPHMIQLIGIRAAREYGVPYIADLKDDWLTNHRHRWHTPLHKWLAAHYERRMVDTAAAVVLNTSVIEDRFRKRYPQHGDKFFSVTNGYDEDDFVDLLPIDLPDDGRKIIAYTGDLYKNFLYVQFSKVIEDLRRAGLDKQWRIVTASPAPPLRLDQRNVWTALGMLHPRAMMTLLDRASLLVVAMPPGERTPSGTIPQKVYPYLRSGKPIIYLGESGSTTDMLSRFPGTFSQPRTEWPHFVQWLQDTPLEAYYRREGIERIGYEHLAARFATIVQNAIARHKVAADTGQGAPA